jgi:phosphate transport system ATP-binding protein
MPKRIEASNVSAWFGSHKAIEDVSLVFEPKQVTALIGPSGCGKSTFIRTLNRMHEVVPGSRFEGKIQLDGQDIYGADVSAPDVRRSIGMVFQRPNPFPTMTVRDNVAAGLRLNGVRKKSELDDAVERALRHTGLWDEVSTRLGRPGAGLSGGQQQRLCIARAIAVQPEVLLMDEPCSALDPVSTLTIEDLITDLKDEYTIVIVTHNMQQAARVSDTTAFFNISGAGQPGRLVEVGQTSKIFTKPDDERTEAYITGRFG